MPTAPVRDAEHVNNLLRLPTVDIHEAALILGVSRRHVYYLIEQGRLVRVHVGPRRAVVRVDSIRALLGLDGL